MKLRALLSTLLIALLLIPSFTACEGDDDDVNAIIAAWVLSSMSASGTDVPGGSITISANSGLVSGTLTFKDDNTVTGFMTIMGESTMISGTWSVSGDQLTINDADGTDVVTYSVSGNTLNLQFVEEGLTSTLTFTK